MKVHYKHLMAWMLVAIFGAMISPQFSVAKTVLKVSHQFAVGDVRDQMVHTFGAMVTDKTKGEIQSKIRQIRLPEDVKGTKLRAAGKKFEYMLKEAGASITSMPSSETYHALSTGVIDTMLTSSASFVSYRLYEVLKYINVPRDNAMEGVCRHGPRRTRVF